MNNTTRRKQLVSALMVATIVAVLPGAPYARDRGINQPGPVGNAGPAGPGRDPGINQPGPAGQRRWTGQGSGNQPARPCREQAGRRPARAPRRPPVALARHAADADHESETMRNTRPFPGWVLPTFFLVGATLPIASVAQLSEVDPNAIYLLRQSTEYLSSLKQFCVEVDTTIEAVLPTGAEASVRSPRGRHGAAP